MGSHSKVSLIQENLLLALKAGPQSATFLWANWYKCYEKNIYSRDPDPMKVRQVDAKPYQVVSRQKRTSDQRLAELETLIALSKMNGKLVTIPIGFGKIDPDKIGRRRRSLTLLLQQLINDVSAEDKRSDEFFQTVEHREEDGGEEKEEKVNRKGQTAPLSEMFPLKTNRHVPVRLLQ